MSGIYNDNYTAAGRAYKRSHWQGAKMALDSGMEDGYGGHRLVDKPLTDKYEIDSEKQQALRDYMLNKIDSKLDKLIDLLIDLQEILKDNNRKKKGKK